MGRVGTVIVGDVVQSDRYIFLYQRTYPAMTSCWIVGYHDVSSYPAAGHSRIRTLVEVDVRSQGMSVIDAELVIVEASATST